MIFLVEKIWRRNKIEVSVYDSLNDLSQRVDWQDILDDSLRILDEKGVVYVWDASKQDQVGTVFNYTFKTNGRDVELANKCNRKLSELGQPCSFEIDTVE